MLGVGLSEPIRGGRAVALNFKDLPSEGQECMPEVRRRVVTFSGAKVIDLRELESKRTRIKGSGYCLSDTERRSHGGRAYLLVAEPDNAVDAKAVAVYSTKGLRVGYLSASAAARYGPMLQQLGADAFKVAGAGTTSSSIMMWVDLPLAAQLRRFVAQHPSSI